MAVFWTQGLFTGWLQYVTGFVVIALNLTIIIAARGVTALPEHQLDERQLHHHRRLMTRAFCVVLWVGGVLTAVLPHLIEKRVIPPLDGGRAFACCGASRCLEP